MAQVVSARRISDRGVAPEPPPDVVVWESDGSPLPGVGYGERVARRLRRAGHHVAVVDHRSRPLTEQELAAPVHVLSGGETSAFAGDRATERSLESLRALAQRAWADEVTLVGICLGSQLLARVVAPELARSVPAGGMEAGWVDVAGPAGAFTAAQLHYEQIHPDLATVDGVEVLLGNHASPIQAFRWGRSVVGMQFHPEWSPTDLRSVIGRHRQLLADQRVDPARVPLATRRAARAWRADAFDALVATPVAERSPVATGLRRAG